jgi:hypothetical protein
MNFDTVDFNSSRVSHLKAELRGALDAARDLPEPYRSRMVDHVRGIALAAWHCSNEDQDPGEWLGWVQQ